MVKETIVHNYISDLLGLHFISHQHCCYLTLNRLILNHPGLRKFQKEGEKRKSSYKVSPLPCINLSIHLFRETDKHSLAEIPQKRIENEERR